MSSIRLAGEIAIDSVVDGPGLRTVLWCQGCTHFCPQCHNPATHCLTGGFETTVSAVVQQILAAQIQSGITFSGGEPMLQAESCAEIGSVLKQQGINIWCYTGFVFEELLTKPKCMAFLRYIDVLVDGRFVPELKSYDLAFRGSANQRLVAVAESLHKNQVVLFEYPPAALGGG